MGIKNILWVFIATIVFDSAVWAKTECEISFEKTPVRPLGRPGIDFEAPAKNHSKPDLPTPQTTSAQFQGGIHIAKAHSIYQIEEVQRALKQLLERGARETDRKVLLYQKLLSESPDRFLSTKGSLEILDQLEVDFPHFANVIHRIKRPFALSLHAGQPLHFRPILLTGPPGVGKTYFASQLAEAMGVEYHYIPMNTQTASWALTGNDGRWENAAPGMLAAAMVSGAFANPLFLVDEIDKAGGGKKYDPVTPLLQLLEIDTAKRFKDEYYDIAFDLKHVNWILTANDSSLLSDPILSRVQEIYVRKPTVQELKLILKKLLARFLKEEYPGLDFSTEVAPEICARLDDLSLRQIKTVLIHAVGNAVLDGGRKQLIPADIDRSILDSNPSNRPIGFIQN